MPHEMHDEKSDQKRLAEIKVNGGPVVEVDEHLEMTTYWARDTNVLWNSLFSKYVQVTGDWEFRDRLWPNFEASVRWLTEHGDIDGALLIEGPHNQWWKDSETSLVDEEGKMPIDPIAALDVNSFAYLSDLASAWLYESRGDHYTARTLRERALKRKDLINKSFWMEDVDLYTPALDTAKKPIKIVTSDSVFPLWVGIPDSLRAKKIVDRLMQPDLLTKWGPRTRSRNSTQYNPAEYQNGNVWYQLASIAATGCERYGLTKEADVFDECVYRSSSELGFPELSEVDDCNNVIPYKENGVPVACNPHTWVIGGVLNRTAKSRA
jgi:glycogen debranching enzyme